METKTIGRYQLEKFLGEGAFAEVYKATDTMLKRPVALKLLKSSLLADREAFSRFVQEAQVASSLTHPHIAWVWDMGEAEGRCYIAMRFIDGKPLDRVIKEKGALPWDEAVRITSEIGEALQTAHDRGLVHRDVKPQNIILSPTEGAVLTDFGLVKAVEATGSTTRTGAIIGTPQYMAPEIWEGKPAGPEADQYALACVLVEMLCGHNPFEAPTPVAVMRRVFEGPRFPEDMEKYVSDHTVKTLGISLSSKPDDRFDRLSDFLQALSGKNVQTIGKSLSEENTSTDTVAVESTLNNEYYKLGDLFYSSGQYDEAIKNYTLAINLDPKNEKLFYARGDSYYFNGEYTKSILDMNRAIELNNRIPDFFYTRGECYFEKGDYTRAIEDITRAIEISTIPDDHYFFARGDCFLAKRNFPKAIEDYTHAIALNSNEGEYFWCRHLAYKGLGRRNEAEVDKKKAIALGFSER